MALAKNSDFEARHGATDERVEHLLDDASALILEEAVGSTTGWARGEEDAGVPPSVKAVCVEIAYRAWSNPDALSSESLGQHTQAWADRSGEAMRMTKAERRLIRRAAGLGSFQTSTLASPYSGDLGEINGPSDNDLLPVSE
jgi:hypothetical protein